MVDMRFSSEFRQAVRSLRRTPGFAALSVVILALGIGGTTAIFSVVNQVLLTPLPYADAGQLVRVFEARSPERQAGSASGPAFAAYRELRSFEAIAASLTFRETAADVTGGGPPERIRWLAVSAGYFDVLRAPPQLGRTFLPEEERVRGIHRAIISHDLWQRRFGGDPGVVGGTLFLDAEPYEIVGVAREEFADPVAGEVDVWLPHALTISAHLAENHYLTVVGRLRPGTSIEQARAELPVAHAALAAEYPVAADHRAEIVALHEDRVGGAKTTLYVLLVAVGLVLLIVCVNLANLLLARATQREREIAVRAALGAGRGRLARQLLMESLLLGAAGGLAGLLLGLALLQGIVALGGASIPRLAATEFDARVLAFGLVVSLGSALLFGLLPALRFSRVEAGGVLRATSRGTTADRGRNRLRMGLVGAQVALAMMLLSGAAILILSFHRLQTVDLGVETAGVLTFDVHLPPARYDSIRRVAFHEELAARMAALPGVQAAGAVTGLPATGSFLTWGTRPGSGPLAGDPDALPFFQTQTRVVSGDYFAVLRIPLLAGRLFDGRDHAAAPPRVVISRSTAEAAFPGADAVGQTLLVLGRPLEVIGVVEDVALHPTGESFPTAYRAHRQFAGDRNWPLVQVVRTAGDPLRLLPAVRAQSAALDPDLLVHRPAAYDAVLGRGIAEQRFTTWLMASFAALALLLASLGLFGVLTYIVRQRRRELGIRSALGARPGQIQAMVLGKGLRVTLVGIAAGLAGAVAGSELLRSLVFETEPADPLVLAAVASVMTAAALLATWLPAREATSVDPATVMRDE
jgi:putative ABC transport system permease protein